MRNIIRVSITELESILSRTFPHATGGKEKPIVYGVPRGGWFIAYILDSLGLARQLHNGDGPEMADIIVDDVIDSGQTRDEYIERFGKPFYAPFENQDFWIVFPWETSKESDAEKLITRVIEHIGDDPSRSGLLETPARVVRSWKEVYGGYKKDPKEVLSKIFETKSDEMVICKGIEFYSTCEHHMIPFHGQVHIGYLPGKFVVGLSKLARLVEIYARRLQIQETMTRQVADAIFKHVKGCRGVGVVVEAKHLCMCGRGVQKQNSVMKTSALIGSFRDDAAQRAEFFNLIG